MSSTGATDLPPPSHMRFEAGDEDLPEGLYQRDGKIMFDCRTCDQPTEWPAEVEDFEPDNLNNVCGRSPRCCP